MDSTEFAIQRWEIVDIVGNGHSSEDVIQNENFHGFLSGKAHMESSAAPTIIKHLYPIKIWSI